MQGLDMSPVPHGHPKNDAATCGKPARNSHSTQDGQKNRTKKNLNLAILKPYKSNRRTSLSPTANFLKKVGQKLLIRPSGPGCFCGG